jgi:hypothetical protein
MNPTLPWPRSRLLQQIAGWLTLACVALLVALAGTAPPARAQGTQAAPELERRVKAAFIYKFLGYTDFPPTAFADPASPVRIGVVGSDEMATDLARIVAGRTVNSRPIVVRALRENELDTPLHLLFVAGSDCARVGRVVKAAAAAMLVVTECDSGPLEGSVINFRIVDQRVRFDVSLDAAEKNNIKLSSRLLSVANRVQKGGQS